MDYFSAFSTVLFSFYAMVIRLLNEKSKFLTVVLSLICLVFFVVPCDLHLVMLTLTTEYNMQANIAVEFVTFSCPNLNWNTIDLSYLSAWLNKNTNFILHLPHAIAEQLPSDLWLIDAHALWHLATSGLPFLFYRFLIDDCKFLRNEKELKRIHDD
ncbi:hypothetical protein L9F63_027875 [Diploptera punctata]|uniref:Post-GPI attachment to proteins factor 3 n=1 Tax=Diploptera punctata TaxID=6984 RepID=A0AAD8A0T6_DIPPU|nr:hypothetical protein L9F63_027875 [Diploptera punctata]